MGTICSCKDEVLIGGLVFLNNWVIRSETSNALGKIILRDQYKQKEEIIFCDEKVIVPSILIQK